MNAEPSSAPLVAKDVAPLDILWVVMPGCRSDVGSLKKLVGEKWYQETREALQETLCGYFNSGNCMHQGSQIYPMGATPSGGKCLKVRCALPGGGKSGGLRIAFIAYCESKQVKIAKMWARKDDPSDAEFAAAVKSG